MDHVRGSRGFAATARRLTPGEPTLRTRRAEVRRHRLAELVALLALLVAAGLALGDTSPMVAL